MVRTGTIKFLEWVMFAFGLNQDQLAEIMGTSSANLSRIKTGKIGCGDEYLDAVFYHFEKYFPQAHIVQEYKNFISGQGDMTKKIDTGAETLYSNAAKFDTVRFIVLAANNHKKEVLKTAVKTLLDELEEEELPGKRRATKRKA